MGQIQLNQVSKSFGEVEVIRPLDLEIADGEFVVFVGPSGCGKSTLLRLIAGLEDVTSGRIEYRRNRRHRPARRPGAGWPWCSSPMRSTRTCRCARTSRFRCAWRGSARTSR